MNILKKIKKEQILFLFSILIFTFIFYLVRSFMTNFDEMDHISAVYLMSHGQKLYSNIFATHFPFPFYWVYAFSSFWVNLSFGKAITNFHFTLAIFYLIVFCLTFLSLKKNIFKSMYSVWIFFLSLILSLYHGNLLLSETFIAILITAIFWILLPVLLDHQKLNLYDLIILIIFTSLAFWTQPLCILLILIPIILSPKKNKINIFLLALIVNLIPLTALALSHQLIDFIKQAIIFNFTVYSKDFPEQINNNSMFIQNINDFFKNQTYLLTHFFTSTQIYQFILNLSFLFFSALIFIKSKFSHKIIYLILFVSLVSRQVKVVPGKIFNFGSYPLIIFSFICLLSLIFLTKKIILKTILIGLVIVCFITGFHDFSPIFKQSLNTNYNYDVFWSYRQRIGENITSLTKSNESILIYPHDPDLYYFSQRLPMDRFTYWYPWYDKTKDLKQERLNSFNDNSPALIYVGDLGYKNSPNAYGQFFPNLTKNYIEVKKDNKSTGIWLRSDLKDRIKP